MLTTTRLQQLTTYIDHADNPRGVTRGQINHDLFHGHVTRPQLDDLIKRLLATGTYEVSDELTGGRPRTWISRHRAEERP